jgi:hypothetical protein
VDGNSATIEKTRVSDGDLPVSAVLSF